MSDHQSRAASPPRRVESGQFCYEVDPDWQHSPAKYQGEVAAVAVDSHDRVYVFNRGDDPVVAYNADGHRLQTWGKGEFGSAHGITIGPDDAVYCTDVFDHTVQKYSLDGKRQMTLGIRGKPSDTGATSIDFRTIRHSGPPFHFPTNVALSLDGELYVADGYGNARIHRFSATGELLHSWGSPGTAPGEFRVPHGIAVDRSGRVFVADRENSRIQIFSPAGDFLEEWSDIARPCQVAFDEEGYAYVAELGYRAGMWPGTSPPSDNATGGRISIFTADGELAARWGGGARPTEPGDFFAPHDIRIDSRGNVYVAEVVLSAGGNRGLVAPDCHTLQKFVRRR
jgi:DNA-binding beta-propeller fold protein YncE